MSTEADIAEQFEKILNSPKQTWLLSAGVSCISNVPLMIPLTKRVFHILESETYKTDSDTKSIFKSIKEEIAEDAHIEIFLTHLADLISLSERSRNTKITYGGVEFSKSKLVEIHLSILRAISDVIRWGYSPESGDKPEEVGTPEKPIVSVDAHKKFVKAIFGIGRAGLEKYRGAVEFFTTNYDTLLEDALSLNQVPYTDGFCGGAVGFWDEKTFRDHQNIKAVVTKLHGSSDWYRPSVSPSPLLRVRYNDIYPDSGGEVMIYPQATKYMNAQIDPFAFLFQHFRKTLSVTSDHVLLICGYSFGDEHINADIDIAMSNPNSQLAIVAFANEVDGKLPKTLEEWRTRSWKDRVYIASQKGLYNGSDGPFFKAENDRDWWTFDGVANLFSTGMPNDIKDIIE